MRFSIRGLLIAVLVIALAVVALLRANEYWAGAARSALFLLLSLAPVFALLATGPRRVFWIGFAFVGIFHFANTEYRNSSLITEEAIEWLDGQLKRDVEILAQTENGLQPMIVRRPFDSDFRGVAQSVTTALIGLLGGYIALWYYRRNNPPAADSEKNQL